MLTLNSVKEVEREIGKRMDKALEAVQREFHTVRGGRASSMLVEGVIVDYYGKPTPIKGLASISTPDSKTIAIQPWDVSILAQVEAAIRNSDLGVSPVNDGKAIRLQMPQITEEKRQELTKVVRKMAEDGKISLRNSRHEAIEAVKRLEKNKQISEDESRTSQKHIQKLTDDHVKKIDDLLKAKETEFKAV